MRTPKTNGDVTAPRGAGGMPDEHALFAALAAQGDDRILVVDVAGRILFGNRDLPAPVGNDPAKATLLALLPEAIHARCHEALRTACERRQKDQFESRWLDGTVRVTRTVPLADQTTATCLVIATDVTGLRRVEASLHESEQRFRQLAENVREVFWLMDSHDRRLLYVTNAYQRVWGRATKDLYDGAIGWFDCVHAEDRARVERAFTAGLQAGAYQAEYRIVRPDGGLRWIRERAFVSRDADGQVSRMAGIAEDITEQRNVEDSLRLERKLLKRLLDLQERERHLLACEIHDGFIQDLVGSKMLLESLRPNLPPDNPCLIARLDKIEGACARRSAKGGG